MSIALLKTTLVAFTVFVACFLASGTNLKAMPVFFDLELTATAGPEAGTVGSGSFSVDGNLITGTGNETLTAASGLLTFDVSFAGVSFGIMDDFEFPNRPFVTFASGAVTGLEFFTGPSDPIATFGIFNGLDFAFTPFGIIGITEGFVTVSRRSVAVAEPASLAIFGLGLLAMGGFARRFRQS